MLRRALSSLSVMALIVTGVAGPLAGSAGAASADEQHVLDLVENRRAQAGMAPLATHPDLNAAAHVWAGELARRGGVAHSSPPPGDYSRWSENVGAGPDVPAVHAAFERSSIHDGNMVDERWTHIGVGTARGADGNVYVVHQFATYGHATTVGPAQEPAPAAAVDPKPAPVAPARALAEASPRPSPALSVTTGNVLRTLRTLDQQTTPH